MKIKRGGNGCYQPEKWAFLAEGAVNNAMFATPSPPSNTVDKMRGL